MRTLISIVAIFTLTAFSACHHEEFCDGYWDDGQYSHGCECWDGDCWLPDPFPDDQLPDDEWPPPDGYAWCSSTAECAEGEMCAPFGQCLALVLDCPLTEECLPDPEGYVPDWMGIDPTYLGEFLVEETQVRLIVNLDFYEDHLYGEGFAEIWSEWGYWEGYNFAVTGSRDGAQLWGQVIETDGIGRNFDLVFEAMLLSASEITGSFHISGDEGEQDGEFTLYRTSPCGCQDPIDPDPSCQEHTDCQDGHICLEGECTQICLDDSDCPEGQICQDHLCAEDETPPPDCTSDEECPEGQVCLDGACIVDEVPPVECCADEDCAEGEACVDNQCVPVCEFACCEDADCPEGEQCLEGECVFVCPDECCADTDCAEGDVCTEGACQTPCELNCQCDDGEICENGYCVPYQEPPMECETDCDCDFSAGYRCIDGICQIP